MKASKRAARRGGEEESADLRRVRDDLFDLLYPVARRAARVRSSRVPRYGDIDREDVEQEALIAVLNAVKRFDDSRGAPATFVERIVFNAVASILRRARAGKRTPPLDDGFLSSRPRLFATLELRLDLDRVLERLGHRERKVARMLQEYRPAETARLLGISRPTVYRAIDRLREALSEAGFE